jgi:hypothetical protein
VLVNGDWRAVVFSLTGPEPPRFTVTGPVRVWVETVDRALPGGNQLATYRLTASLDDQPLAKMVLDRFDWNWPAEVEWTFHEPLAREHDERWVALDAPPGTRQPVHGSQAAGVWDHLAPGEHRLTLVGEDFAGNATRREAALVLDPQGALRTVGRQRGGWSLGDGFVLTLPGVVGDVQVAESGPAGRIFPGDWVLRRGAGGMVLSRRGSAAAGAWTFTAMEGENVLVEITAFRAGEGELSLRQGEFSALIPQSAVYGPLWITMHGGGGIADPGALEPELEGVGAAYRCEPWGTPLRDRVRAALNIPEGADWDGLGVYSRAGDRWRFESAEREGNGMQFTLGNLEEVALFRDNVPPSVSPFVATGPRPGLGAVIADSGSGVTASTLILQVDGMAVIAEWDPEAGRLRAHLREDLAAGEHVLEAFAVDRAGNAASARAVFSVP